MAVTDDEKGRRFTKEELFSKRAAEVGYNPGIEAIGDKFDEFNKNMKGVKLDERLEDLRRQLSLKDGVFTFYPITPEMVTIFKNGYSDEGITVTCGKNSFRVQGSSEIGKGMDLNAVIKTVSDYDPKRENADFEKQVAIANGSREPDPYISTKGYEYNMLAGMLTSRGIAFDENPKGVFNVETVYESDNKVFVSGREVVCKGDIFNKFTEEKTNSIENFKSFLDNHEDEFVQGEGYMAEPPKGRGKSAGFEL